MEENNWRSAVTQESRHNVVLRIFEILPRDMSLSESGEGNGLYETVVLLEEMIFAEATDQDDYINRLSSMTMGFEGGVENGSSSESQPLNTYPQLEEETEEIIWTEMQGLKEKYLDDLKGLISLIQERCQQPMPQEKLMKLSHYKTVLKRMIPYLCAPKGILPKEFTMDKMEAFKIQMINIMENYKRRKITTQATTNLNGLQKLPDASVRRRNRENHLDKDARLEREIS